MPMASTFVGGTMGHRNSTVSTPLSGPAERSARSTSGQAPITSAMVDASTPRSARGTHPSSPADTAKLRDPSGVRIRATLICSPLLGGCDIERLGLPPEHESALHPADDSEKSQPEDAEIEDQREHTVDSQLLRRQSNELPQALSAA